VSNADNGHFQVVTASDGGSYSSQSIDGFHYRTNVWLCLRWWNDSPNRPICNSTPTKSIRQTEENFRTLLYRPPNAKYCRSLLNYINKQSYWPSSDFNETASKKRRSILLPKTVAKEWVAVTAKHQRRRKKSRNSEFGILLQISKKSRFWRGSNTQTAEKVQFVIRYQQCQRYQQWLRIPQRIQYKLCVLVFNCLHGTAPRYLQEVICPVENIEPRRRLRSASCAVTVTASRLTWQFD